MAWHPFNAETLFPGATQDALEATGEVAEQVATAAETIASAIDVLSDLLYDMSDPLKAATDKLINALRDLLADVLATGIYLYHDTPSRPLFPKRSFDWASYRTLMDVDGVESRKREEIIGRGGEYEEPEIPLEPGRAHGWLGWKAKWADSLYDQGDERRPQFSDDAQVSALLFIAGVPSLDALPNLLAALGKLFGIKAFTDAFGRLALTTLSVPGVKGTRVIEVNGTEGFWVDRQVLIGSVTALTPAFAFVKSIDHAAKRITLYDPLSGDYIKGSPVSMTSLTLPNLPPSYAPDWWSKQMRDLPPMQMVEDQVNRLIGILEMSGGLVTLLQELADALSDKADALRELADEIAALIQNIEDIIALTGVFIARVDSDTGIPGLIDAASALGAPGDLPAKSFIAGVCLLAGTADMGPIAELFGA